MARIDVLKAQLSTSQAYVEYWLTRVNTGAYKGRVATHGDGTPFTEDELRNDELGSALNHLRRMNDLADSICEAGPDYMTIRDSWIRDEFLRSRPSDLSSLNATNLRSAEDAVDRRLSLLYGSSYREWLRQQDFS